MKKSMILIALLAGSVMATAAPTKVLFCFDTEDFTCDESSDAIRDIANLLTEEGVVGHFDVVGLLAEELVRHERFDVIKALRPHSIGTQTLRHSLHPTICERTDMEDYRAAYLNAMSDEAQCVGMVKAAFGLDRVDWAVLPGDSWSYVSLYVYSDLGMTFHLASGFEDDHFHPQGLFGIAPTGNRRWSMWYQNMLQIPYSNYFSLEDLIPTLDRPLEFEGRKPPAISETLDRLAERDAVVLYMHPHLVIKKAHWDGPNYIGTNRVEWGKWVQIPNHPKEVTEGFYRNFRAFIRRVKSDKRFAFTDLSAEKRNLKARRPIVRADLPAIRKALLAKFGHLAEPGSYCVADVFQCVCRMLVGDGEFTPGRVYGFLEPPVGVAKPCSVSAADLRAAAKRLDLREFIPPRIEVGGVKLGPADFLFAALEVLVTGADEAKVVPREQLGSFEECPGLGTIDIKGGWCVHSPSMNGRLLDDRLKLQLWTMRFE